jgi:galactokinase
MRMSTPEMIARELTQRFGKLFGDHPRIFRAPGRVNLIGEHTDYNDGFVMPAAVGFSTYVAIAARPDRKLVIHSEEFPGNFEFDLDHLPERRTGAWCDYVLGVASVLQRGFMNFEAANLLVHGEVPIGAGLSSSAAVEVSSALACMSMSETHPAAPRDCEALPPGGEHFRRRPCRHHGPVCLLHGQGRARLLLLDCRSLEFQFAPIPKDLRLVVCNTMVKHDLATGAYNTRREECEEGVRLFAMWDPQFTRYATCQKKCSIGTCTTFPRRLRNDVLTSSAKTSAHSMPRGLSRKGTCFESGN